MSDSTPGRSTESQKRKSPPVIDKEEETPGTPEKVRLCLRSVVKKLSKWRVDAKDLVFAEENARERGGSADVARAKASIFALDDPDHEDVDVAVKKFRLSGDVNRRTQTASFANELSLLSELDHENIVKLTGFVESAGEDIAWILLRWENNGNIREFIHSQDWVIPERIALIYDVACGLNYLHSRDPPICHRDLKSMNILVNSESMAVITDFGSARRLESRSRTRKEKTVANPIAPVSPRQVQDLEQGVSLLQIEECETFLTLTGPAYTIRWAAPEVLRDDEFSLASDMWAFAWICWEIMTGSVPFDNLQRESVIIVNVIRGNLPQVTSNEHVSQVHILCAMMTRCWKMDPTRRPTAKECEISFGSMNRIAPTRRGRASELESYSTNVLFAVGNTKYRNLRFLEAKEYFARALKVARSVGDTLAAANAMIGQGKVCCQLNEHAEAESLLTAARETFEKQAADAFCRLKEASRNPNESSKAGGSYTEGCASCAYRKATKGVADANWELGEIYLMRGEFSKAEASYTESRKVYELLGAEEDVADAAWILGEVYRLQNEYSKSEASYTEARECFARLGAEQRVADATWGLGVLYRSRGECSKAEASYTEAKEIYARLGDEKAVADAILGLGDLNQFLRQYSKAEASFTEAREIFSRLGAEQRVAYVNCELGRVHLMQNEYSKAETSYNKAREIYSRLGAKQRVADAIWGLGCAYRSRNEYPKAKAAFIEARDIYTKTGYQQGVGMVLSSLAELLEEERWSTEAEGSHGETSIEAGDEA